MDKIEKILKSLEGKTIEKIDWIIEPYGETTGDLCWLYIRTTDQEVYEFRPYLDSWKEEMPVISAVHRTVNS